MREVTWRTDGTTKLLLGFIGVGLWVVALRPVLAPVRAEAQEAAEATAALPRQMQALLKAVRDPAHPIPISLTGGSVEVRVRQGSPLQVELAGPTEVTVASKESGGLPVSVRQPSFDRLRVRLEGDSGPLQVRVTDFEPDPLGVRMR